MIAAWSTLARKRRVVLNYHTRLGLGDLTVKIDSYLLFSTALD